MPPFLYLCPNTGLNLQVLLRQARQDRVVNLVLAECSLHTVRGPGSAANPRGPCNGNIVNLKSNKKGERGQQRLGGRRMGTPNKTTQILKYALLDAASELGFPEEVTLLDDDGRPTGVIRLKKTTVCRVIWNGLG
jgi:hypothetical protein